MTQEKGLVTLRLETSILLVSFLIAIVLGIIIIPILKKLKVGQIERDDGPKSHLKKQGTPTMGGIIIIITMILVMTGTYIYFTWNNQNDLANKLLPMLILTIGFGMIGFIDDFKKLVLKNTEGLKPKYKMLGLLIISVIYVLYLIEGLQLGTRNLYPYFSEVIRSSFNKFLFVSGCSIGFIPSLLFATNYLKTSLRYGKLFRSMFTRVVYNVFQVVRALPVFKH